MCAAQAAVRAHPTEACLWEGAATGRLARDPRPRRAPSTVRTLALVFVGVRRSRRAYARGVALRTPIARGGPSSVPGMPLLIALLAPGLPPVATSEQAEKAEKASEASMGGKHGQRRTATSPCGGARITPSLDSVVRGACRDPGANHVDLRGCELTAGLRHHRATAHADSRELVDEIAARCSLFDDATHGASPHAVRRGDHCDASARLERLGLRLDEVEQVAHGQVDVDQM